MMRSAPSSRAASTPSSPTAPSPTTANRLTGCDGGGEPAGAEHVGGGQQERDELLVGHGGCGDECAVGQRDTCVLGLGTDGAHQLGVHAAGLVAGLADFAGVVGGEERADDELAGLEGGDVGADFFDDADVLVAHRCGSCPACPALLGADGGQAGQVSSKDRLVSKSLSRGQRQPLQAWSLEGAIGDATSCSLRWDVTPLRAKVMVQPLLCTELWITCADRLVGCVCGIRV